MKNDRSLSSTLWADRALILFSVFAALALICLTASIAIQPAQVTRESGSPTLLPQVMEVLGNATLAVTIPDDVVLTPYMDRGFDDPEEAAIAWWMYPGFMANTSEYRSYLRAQPDAQAKYDANTRVFFDFITDNLDDAENASLLPEDMLFYRGIGSYALTVINSSRYNDNSYASTSYDPTVCLGSFGSRTADGYQNVLVMQADRGDHALFINDEAREFLIPRGTSWVVTLVKEIGNLTIQADFPLTGNGNRTAFYTNVRLIYLDEIESL